MTRRAWVHPIADLPCLKADWHLSLGVGHNEHLLHHRCGGRDHSSRRFFGPASIRKSCKPCPRAVPSGHDTRARHRAFGFWIAGATLIVAKPGEQFYTDAVDQRAHPSRIKPPSKVTPGRNTSGGEWRAAMHDSRRYRDNAAECLFGGSRSMRTSLPQTSSLYGRLVAFARPSG
jgi:hypothetical protein